MNANKLRIVLGTALIAMAALASAQVADNTPVAKDVCPCCAAQCPISNAAALPQPVAAACPTARNAPATQPVASTPATRPASMGPGAMARGGMGMGNAGPMRLIHALLDNHQKIARMVKEIPGGVETLTTSNDPAVAREIAAHVRQMHDRMQAGQPIRMWDPLFVELFRHRDQIKMEITDVPGGVKVTATSADPQVTLLIRQHATKGVDEFVASGWDRVHQPTTLPSGYRPSR